MELRHLQYFLTIAREGTISGAAQALHLSQPSLSRQMQDLERELDVKLFNRGSRHIELTEEGMRLRRRAEEIVDLVGRTEAELRVSAETIAGEVRIGSGETPAMDLVAPRDRRNAGRLSIGALCPAQRQRRGRARAPREGTHRLWPLYRPG